MRLEMETEEEIREDDWEENWVHRVVSDRSLAALAP